MDNTDNPPLTNVFTAIISTALMQKLTMTDITNSNKPVKPKLYPRRKPKQLPRKPKLNQARKL